MQYETGVKTQIHLQTARKNIRKNFFFLYKTQFDMRLSTIMHEYFKYFVLHTTVIREKNYKVASKNCNEL